MPEYFLVICMPPTLFISNNAGLEHWTESNEHGVHDTSLHSLIVLCGVMLIHVAHKRGTVPQTLQNIISRNNFTICNTYPAPPKGHTDYSKVEQRLLIR